MGGAVLKMPEEAINTSDYILFKDQLFDSVNGQSLISVKPLQEAIKNGSAHIAFWQQAKQKLFNMRFVDKITRAPYPNPLCLKACPDILNVMEKVWYKVQDLGFPYLKLGLLNQDVLENFFSILRGFSYRFVKLNCMQVQGIFKTVLINTFASNHSKSSNCEADSAKMLAGLNSFLNFEDNNGIDKFNENDESEHPQRNQLRVTKWSFTVQKSHAVIFARKLLLTKNFEDCNNCKTVFFGTQNNDASTIINERAMDYFERGYLRSTTFIFRKLPQMCFRRNVCSTLLEFLKPKIDFEWITCLDHKNVLADKFLKMLIVNCIHKWCIHLNKILNGTIINHGGSIVENNARQEYIKHTASTQGKNKQRGYRV